MATIIEFPFRRRRHRAAALAKPWMALLPKGMGHPSLNSLPVVRIERETPMKTSGIRPEGATAPGRPSSQKTLTTDLSICPETCFFPIPDQVLSGPVSASVLRPLFLLGLNAFGGCSGAISAAPARIFVQQTTCKSWVGGEATGERRGACNPSQSHFQLTDGPNNRAASRISHTP